MNQPEQIDDKNLLNNMRLLHDILTKDDGRDNFGKRVYMPIPNHNFIQNPRTQSTTALAKVDAY